VPVARIRIGRAARATLLALGATVSVDTGCGTASYGGGCRPDACAFGPPTKDAEDETTFTFPDVEQPDAADDDAGDSD
jgi:hypothetical protein